MKQEFISPERFFELLYVEPSFCQSIGKVMLAVGALETQLRRYLRARDVTGVRANATLGSMVGLLKKHKLLSLNGELLFNALALKRNYLAHSIYDLFNFEVDETLLPRSELVELDVQLFSDRAKGLADDFNHFRAVVSSADPATPRLL